MDNAPFDIIDFRGDVDDPAAAFEGAPARACLIFRSMWFDAFGVYPPSSVYADYCGNTLMNVPPTVNQFVAHAEKLQMPVAKARVRDKSSYIESLGDAAFLKSELVNKLLEKYSSPLLADRLVGFPILDARDKIRQHAATAEAPLDYNPVTNHYVGGRPEAALLPKSEWWKEVMTKDKLMASRQTHGMCVFVEADADDDTVSVVCEAASDLSKGPITVMTDDPDTMKRLDRLLSFYHYRYLVEEREAYAAMPRMHESFVLLGGSGVRPPLCLDRHRCWHYASKPPELRSEEAGYAVVLGCIDALEAAEKNLDRLCYFVPRVLHSEEKTVRVGAHPDSAACLVGVTGTEVVMPSEAAKCEVYITCKSGEGAAECMCGGGTVVVGSDRNPYVNDMFNGFVTDGKNATKVLRSALSSDREEIGRNAESLLALHSRETSACMWKHLLAAGDAYTGRKPQQGSVLHDRFLAIGCSKRWREIVRYRVTPCMRRAVVYMDNRVDPVGVFSIMLTFANLMSGWGAVVFAAPDNADFLRRRLGFLGDVEFVEMSGFHSKSFFIEQYNAKFKSRELWERIHESADVALCVQNDGLLVRRGLEDHPAMQYDFTGAPWVTHPYLSKLTSGNLVGNGGFSLRSVEEMLRVCDAHSREALSVYPMAPSMSIAEDVFFSARVRKPCPQDIAKTFSVEQVAYQNSLGYHRFWMYHPIEFTILYFNRLLGSDKPSVESAAAPPEGFKNPRRRSDKIL